MQKTNIPNSQFKNFLDFFKDSPGRLIKYIELLTLKENSTTIATTDKKSLGEVGVVINTKCNLKCKYESNISRKKRGELLDKCICASSKKYISDDLPPSLYQKYKFHTCNPYNGSYCQCTNNQLTKKF